jgi:WD40 repeat protein
MADQLVPTGLPAGTFALIICPGGAVGDGGAAVARRGADALRRDLTGPGGLAATRVEIFDGPHGALDVALALTRAGTVATELLLVCWLGLVDASAGEPLLIGDPTKDGQSGTLRFSQLLALVAASPAQQLVAFVDGWHANGVGDNGDAGHDVAGAFVTTTAHQDGRLELLVAVSEAESVFAAGPLPPAVTGVDRLLAGGDPDGPESLTVGGVLAATQALLDPTDGVRAVHVAGSAADMPIARNVARLIPTDLARVEPTVVLPDGGANGPVPAAADLAATTDAEALSPYPGLASFDAGSQRFFFGRSEAVDDVLGALRFRPADAGPLVLVGASGAGKSSVLRAGVLPALRRGELPGLSADHVQVVLTPGEHPLAALAARVLEEISAPGLSSAVLRAVNAEPASFASLVDELLVHRALRDPAMSSLDLASTPVGPTAARPTVSGPAAARHLVVAVDQFEETFTLCVDEAERAAFIEALVSLATPGPDARRGPATVLITVRGDFYLPCVDHPLLAQALARGQVVIGPMRPEDIREVVVRPAAAVGAAVEPALVELVLDDLADESMAGSGSLPLLAHALRATWELRVAGRLTVDAYRGVGRLTGALTKTADGWFTGLDAAAQETARALLLGLVRVGELGEATRRPRQRAALLAEVTGPGAAGVLDQLIGGLRLVEADEDRVQITHEALLRAWPRLREWLELDRAGALVRQRLDDGGQDWEDNGRDPALLLRGQRLAAAREWAEPGGRRRPLPSPAADFYEASVTNEQAETDQVRRRARRLLTLVAALTVVALVAAGMTTFAFVSRAGATAARNGATAAENRASSAHIADIADSISNDNSEVGAQMALVADRTADTPEARTSILSADTPTRLLHAHQASIGTVAWNPDGRTVASGSDDGIVKLWDVTVGTSVAARPVGAPLRQGTANQAHAVKAVTFDRTGHLMAVGTANGEVRIYDVTNRAAPRVRDTLPPAPLAGGGVFGLVFSPKADLLAAGGYGNSVALFDVSAPGAPRFIGALATGAAVRAVAFSPDGTLLATGGEDGRALLWNVTNPASASLPQVLYTPQEDLVRTTQIRAIAFSPAGDELAVETIYDALIRYAVMDGTATRVGRLSMLTSQLTALAYITPHTLALASDGNVVATVPIGVQTGDDSTDDASSSLTETDLRATPWSLALDPKDRYWIVVSGSDGALRWIRWEPRATFRRATPAAILPRSASSTITVTDRQDLFVYDDVIKPGLPSEQRLRAAVTLDLDGDPYAVGNASLSTARGILAVNTGDKISLWDVSDRAIASWPRYDPAAAPPTIAPLAVLPRAVDQTISVAVSADGRQLAIGDLGGVELWDITNPRAPTMLGAQLSAFKPTGAVQVAFSPDGTRLAAASNDQTFKVWPVAGRLTGGPEATLNLGDEIVSSPVFRPDGHVVALGGEDGQVRLVDVSDPTRLRVAGTTTRQASGTNVLAFSADGRRLVAGGSLQTRIWDVSDPRKPQWFLSFPTLAGVILTGTFQGAGDYLMAAFAFPGSDPYAALVDLNIARNVQWLCANMGDPVTKQEWDTYLDDVPYVTPCGRAPASTS